MGFGTLTAEERQAFERDLGGQRIRNARVLAVMGGILYALFGLLDWWAIPSALWEVWAIRAIVVIWLAGLYWLTRTAFFRVHYATVMVATFLVLGAGIEMMVLLAGPQDVARWLYYTGLILVVMALYTFTFLSVWVLAAVGFSFAVLYLMIAVAGQGMSRGSDASVLLANCFFLFSANVIGVVAAIQRQRLLQESFQLRQKLRVRLARTMSEKERSEWMARHDPLTGLANRAALMQQLQRGLEAARSGRGRVAVLFVDLDGFKTINDRLGHEAGDQVLRTVAQRLKRSVRERDLVARLGGDEFAVVLWLDADGDPAAIDRVVQAIEEVVAQPFDDPPIGRALGASVGVACSPEDGDDPQQLLRRADANMYRVKTLRHAQRPTRLPGT